MNEIYYNFIRPHQGLNGRTPAEATELELMEKRIPKEKHIE
jgi:hypothetical protein